MGDSSLEKNSKIKIVRPRKIWFVPLIIFFILLLNVTLYFFKDKFPFLKQKNKITGNNITSDSSVSNPFEKLIDDVTDEQINYIPNEIPTTLRKPIDFILSNKAVPEDERPVLNEGDIMIEVFEYEDSKIYKVVAFKNQSFKYEVGDEIEFKPEIDPELLFVIKEDNIIYKSTHKEVDGFKIPDSLISGDRVVFSCMNPTCENNVLTWALVFENY